MGRRRPLNLILSFLFSSVLASLLRFLWLCCYCYHHRLLSFLLLCCCCFFFFIPPLFASLPASLSFVCLRIMKFKSLLLSSAFLYRLVSVSATSSVTFYSDTQCSNAVGVEDGPDDGTCTQFTEGLVFGSFKVTSLDKTCAGKSLFGLPHTVAVSVIQD